MMILRGGKYWQQGIMSRDSEIYTTTLELYMNARKLVMAYFLHSVLEKKTLWKSNFQAKHLFNTHWINSVWLTTEEKFDLIKIKTFFDVLRTSVF